MSPVDVKQGREALAGREDHPAWGGTCRVPVAGNCLVSLCPLGPGGPPKTTTSRPPAPSREPSSSLSPPSRAYSSFQAKSSAIRVAPPPFRVPLYSPVSSPLQGPCLLWALIPQPGALSALWTGPSTSWDPFLYPLAPSSFQGPPLFFRSPLPPGSPPRAPTAHVGLTNAEGKEDKAEAAGEGPSGWGGEGNPTGVPLPTWPQGASWRPRFILPTLKREALQKLGWSPGHLPRPTQRHCRGFLSSGRAPSLGSFLEA